MGTADITRLLNQPTKHLVGARLQQGRVVGDADFNERQTTELHDVRSTLVDLIGPKGTPDSGFRVFDPVTVSMEGQDHLDFEIDVGTMYLGGIRFELDAVEQARWQLDWLQLRPADLPVAPDLVGTQTRTDLIYIEGLEEIVTAREDRELLEQALGGKDTSTRVRKSRRVRALVDVGDVACHDAFGKLSDAIFAECRYRIDPATSAVVPVDGTLRMRVEAIPPELNTSLCPPCEPDPQGPFLGADHRAIRVMVSADNKAFTWGFDNAAPLYRVQVDVGGTVTFVDRPSDPQHYPRAGEVVEILGWSRLLDNGEKVATATGFMTRAATAFDPFTGELVLDEPIPAGALVTSWPGHPNADELPGPEGLTYYLRVWNRGAIGESLPEPLLPIVSGALVPLGSTGIGVRWTGSRGCPGDFWVIAHRPVSPHRVLPWVLFDEPVPAFGPRRHVAPLALVTWRLDGEDLVVDPPHDCRTRFGPLTCSRTCCVLTVGGIGGAAAGNFATLQAAIDALPTSGGCICVLPGEHEGRFAIRDRNDIEIIGCGPASRLVVAQADGNTDPLGFLCNVKNVRIADLAIAPRGVPGIQVRELHVASTADVVLEGLAIQTAAEHTAQASPKPAIELLGGDRVTVRNCRLGMPRGEPSLHPVVFISGREVTFDHNVVECTGGADAGRRAWGGVQLGGDAFGVLVRGNRISGGFGHGVTLGSIAYVVADPEAPAHVVPVGVAAMTFAYGVDPRLSLEVLRPYGTAPGAPQPQEGSCLDRIAVRDNFIEDQGGSGIAVPAFWPLESGAPAVMLGVSNLNIEDNRIERCLNELPVRLSDLGTFVAAGGGICLGDVDGLRVTGNVIRDCAPRRAACGVFAVHASQAVIERNVIEGMGREGGNSVGAKGGIVLFSALSSIRPPEEPPDSTVEELGNEIRTAARIVGNRVQQPSGRALQVAVIGGGLVVTSNYFGSHGDDQPGPSVAPCSLQVQAGRVNNRSGLVVDLFNGGLAYDFVTQLTGEDPVVPEFFDDGRILFTDNQVALSWETRIARGPFLASVLLQSLDEAAVVGNQLVAKLDGAANSTIPAQWPSLTLNPVFAMGNLLLTQLCVVGITVKINENRFTEGVTDALISAVGIGVVPFSVMARLNHSTHCVIAGYVDEDLPADDRVLNHELINPPAPSDPETFTFCDSTRTCITPLEGGAAGTFAFQVELDCADDP